jgi:hypothetical protein
MCPIFEVKKIWNWIETNPFQNVKNWNQGVPLKLRKWPTLGKNHLMKIISTSYTDLTHKIAIPIVQPYILYTCENYTI